MQQKTSVIRLIYICVQYETSYASREGKLGCRVCVPKVRQNAASFLSGESCLATACGVVASFGATLGSFEITKDMSFSL